MSDPNERSTATLVAGDKAHEIEGAPRSGAAADTSDVVAAQRDIQKEVCRDDGEDGQKQGGAMQAGAREYPVPPFPEQHHAKPGIEARLEPAPMYDAPFWKGSGKLEGMVALITGGDFGIGRAVAVLFAREGADVAIAHLRRGRRRGGGARRQSRPRGGGRS